MREPRPARDLKPDRDHVPKSWAASRARSVTAALPGDPPRRHQGPHPGASQPSDPIATGRVLVLDAGLPANSSHTATQAGV